MSEPDAVAAPVFAESARKGFMAKADHNKREALVCFVVSIACTLSAPLFVTLGQDWLWGKCVPSCLSLAAAGFTAWIQLRKPQQLWALYRTCQRRIEDQQSAYQYKFLEYADHPFPERLLAERVANIVMFAHEQWMPLIPSPEGVGRVADEAIARKAS